MESTKKPYVNKQKKIMNDCHKYTYITHTLRIRRR